MTRILAILALTVCAHAVESVRLCWDANSEESVVGYRVYAGTNSRQYFIVSNEVGRLNTTSSVALPFPAHWFFAVTATNQHGLESAYSAEVEWMAILHAPTIEAASYVRLTPQAQRTTNLVTWDTMEMEPTLVPATNAQEFYRVTGLGIEPVKLANPN